MAKIAPAVTQLLYNVPNGDSYIDLAADLSRVNRRLYSQQYTYVVNDIQIVTTAGMRQSDISTVEFATTGNSWMVHNAWSKARGFWNMQQRNARKITGGAGKPTWEDFKIYLDDSHRAGTTLVSIAGDGAAYSSGEWLHSKILYETDANAVQEWYLHMIGGDVSTTDKGLILGYQQSRTTVQAEDPDIPGEASLNMYSLVITDTDAVSDEVMQNMEDENDQPPYDHDDYAGNDTNADAAVPVRTLTCAGSQGSSGCPGFIAPCGLIKLTSSELAITNDPNDANEVYAAGTSPTVQILVTLAAGPYKGVLASPMGQ